MYSFYRCNSSCEIWSNLLSEMPMVSVIPRLVILGCTVAILCTFSMISGVEDYGSSSRLVQPRLNAKPIDVPTVGKE